MNDSGHCSLCGSAGATSSPVSGVGPLCTACLLAGRFLGATSAPRLSAAAEQLPGWGDEARALIEPAMTEATRLMEARQVDGARTRLLAEARVQLRDNRPLVAAHLLLRALQLPGPSAEVYSVLGQAAAAMGCEVDARQHLKTAGWLAMKIEDRALVEQTLAALEPLCAGDPWLDKTRAWLEEHDDAPLACAFCGRPPSQAGPLVEGLSCAGPVAAICGDCIARLSTLSGKDSN